MIHVIMLMVGGSVKNMKWEYFPKPQNGPCFGEIDHYSSCGWKDQNQRDFTYSYPIHQEPAPLNYPTSHPSFTCPNSSSFEYASAQNSVPILYNSFYHPQNSFHYPQESCHFQNTQPPLDRLAESELILEELKRKREEETLDRIELLLKKMIKIKEKEKIATREYEEKLRQTAQSSSEEQVIERLKSSEETTSLSPETEEFIQWSRAWRQEQDIAFRNIEANLNHIAKYFEEMPSKEDEDQMEEVVRVYKPKAPYPQRLLGVTKKHVNSFPKDSMQHHVEEREEANQGSPHSNEIESCIEGEFSEPPIQEVLDEKDAPTIQQYPSLEIKDVKAVNTIPKRRIETEKQRTISMKKRRSRNNPTADPTSKFTQANHKRKLARERPSPQGALTGSFFHLRSFLLTNWKKRKKVMNKMSS
ncbi:hypothetical protein AHAS_Ahas13G0352400 [Arachis hypogaea]